MGKRGPAPKPTALKVLQGNPGKRKLNDSEPTFEKTDEILKPPSYLSTYAKKEWKRIAPMLIKNNLLTDADITALAAYCQSYDDWINAEKAKRTYGTVFITDKGNVIQRPEVGIANKAKQEMRAWGKEFGLTPSSRSQLHIEKTEEVEDPFMTFLKGSKSSG